MLPEERRRLREQVGAWFAEAEQVQHYRAGATAGPTAAEERLLLESLPSGGRVLDLGCGAGRLAVWLAERGYQVVGADVSVPLCAAAAALARQRRCPAQFLRVGPLALPFASGSFDAILAVKLYGYIPAQADRLAYLREIARVLRPGAPLLLTSHVVLSEDEALAALAGDAQHAAAAAGFSSLERLDTFAAGRGYVHWFTAAALEAEVSGTGFAIEDAFDDGFQRLLRARPAT